MKLEEMCAQRNVRFTAHLPLGRRDGVRLSLVNLLSTAVGRPPLHLGPHSAKTILRLPEMNVVPLGTQSVILSVVNDGTTENIGGIVRWFRHEVSFKCTFDYGWDYQTELAMINTSA